MKQIKLLLGGAMMLFALAVNAQGSNPLLSGQQNAFLVKKNTSVAVPTYALQAFNWQQIQLDDLADKQNGTYPRIARTQQVNLPLANSGVWEYLPNGDRVWKLRVKSEDALGLIFSFKNMNIPQGASISVYNDDMSDALGPFNHKYSPSSGDMAIGIVKGEAATIEYYEPFSVLGQGAFTLTEVAHAYRMVDLREAVNRDFGDSDPCQVNVNCAPEGNNWQDEKRGVGRILLKDGSSWGWCSGSLVNNTSQNCAPLFLTAFHCGETSSTADKNQWFFYFNYESAGCSNGSNPIPNPYNPPAGSSTTQGCQLVAHSNDGGGSTGSDFLLVNLNNLTPTQISNWNLYFNGWNRANTAATGGVGIHHPSGDIKKISTFTGTLQNASWGGTPGTHWRVTWTSTANGHGVTEGGSSGSPIFNNSGLIVGTLTGGSSYCSTPTSPDLYGKMSYHWNGNASPTGGPLSQHLDPGNTGVTNLNGTYSPCTPSAPTCAATASATTVNAGQTVNFFDGSTGGPTSWSWNFGGGGTPATSTAQNPTNIAFNTPGTYTVTLTASNAQGNCSTTLTITVVAPSGCDTLNFPPPGTLIYGYGSSAIGYVAGTNTFGEVSKAQRFANYAPNTHVTGGFVYVANATASGGGAIARFHIWNEVAGQPGTSLGSLDVPMTNLATIVGGAPTIIQVFFNGAVNVGGNPFYFGVEMVNFVAGDTIAIITNTAGDGSAAINSWEQWNDFTWHTISDSWNLPNDPNDFIDLFMSPFVTVSPVTAVLTPLSGLSGCVGTPLDFTGASSVNATSYEWSITAGTPATGTAVTFSTTAAVGSHTLFLETEGVCGGYSFTSVSITINDNPTVTTTQVNQNCGTLGSITATGAGGSGGGYQYSLNGGAFQGSNTFNNLIAGTYSITVQDGNGCIGQTSVTITNAGSSLTVTGTTVAEQCGSSNGSLTILASGGTGPYEYSINGTTYQASPTFNGLGAGTYTIFARDMSNGCTGNSTVTITNNTYTLTVTATPTDENCGAADGSILVNATGGSTPYQYSLNAGAPQGSATFTGLTSGAYSISVTDQFGCSGTTTSTVGNSGGPSIITVTPTQPSCNGSTDGGIVISATGATQYSINGGSTFQAGSAFTGLPAGTYNIVVSDGGSCDATSSVTLNNPAAVLLNTTFTNASCVTGGTITATASGGSGAGFQYSVNNGATFQASGSFTGLAAGSYQVIAQDGNGCQSIMTVVTIGGSTNITLTETPVDENCSGNNGSITLVASGGAGSGYQYSINGGSTFQATGAFSGLAAGTYSILVTDPGGCTATSSITLANIGAVNGTITPSQAICSGTSIFLTATGGGTYNWNPGGQTTATISVTPTMTTVYSVLVDNGTCTQILNTTITVNTTPVTSVSGNVTICAGQSTTLSASGGTSYDWTPGGQTTASITVSPTVTTTYQVTAINGTCSGNTVSSTVTVNPAPTAVANATPTTVSLSSGGTVNFSSAGSTVGGGISYVWVFGDGNTSAQQNPTHTYTAAGTYTITLTVSDATCSGTATITVIVIDDTSIGEINFSEAVGVYPNPSNGSMNLSFALNQPKNLQVHVFDAIGSLVHTKQLNGVTTGIVPMDLSAFADGFYFVRVSDGQQSVTLRVSVIK